MIGIDTDEAVVAFSALSLAARARFEARALVDVDPAPHTTRQDLGRQTSGLRLDLIAISEETRPARFLPTVASGDDELAEVLEVLVLFESLEETLARLVERLFDCRLLLDDTRSPEGLDKRVSLRLEHVTCPQGDATDVATVYEARETSGALAR